MPRESVNIIEINCRKPSDCRNKDNFVPNFARIIISRLDA